MNWMLSVAHSEDPGIIDKGKQQNASRAGNNVARRTTKACVQPAGQVAVNKVVRPRRWGGRPGQGGQGRPGQPAGG